MLDAARFCTTEQRLCCRQQVKQTEFGDDGADLQRSEAPLRDQSLLTARQRTQRVNNLRGRASRDLIR